ncbi:MAG: hypothetical protein ABR576_02630 [Thermoanaerobaculia bacterium]
MERPPRIFLLSPASVSGERANLVFSDRARSSIAQGLRSRSGVPLGDVFAFLSGLYFRGKLVYAHAFAHPPAGVPGTLVITTSRGLMTPAKRVTLRDLAAFAAVPIDLAEPRYRRPLTRDARVLRDAAGDACEVVLLGSVATGKYVDILLEAFGDKLRFPAEFVGRGDMSRGGLLLRAVADRRELDYIPIAGAQRHGRRPPKLEKRQPGLLAAVLRSASSFPLSSETAEPPAPLRPTRRSRGAPSRRG